MHLNSKTTCGLPAWTKYIVNNPSENISVKIENNLNNIPIYSKSGDIINQVSEGYNLKIVNKEIKSLFNKPLYAETNKGYVCLRHIRKPTTFNMAKYEEIATNNLNKQIQEIPQKSITITFGKYEFKDIVEADCNISGNPKADIVLKDSKGEAKCFISHKKGGGSKSFQQYCGLSKSANIVHYEVDDFLETLSKTIIERNNKPEGWSMLSFIREVKSEDLKRMAIFGYDALRKEYGLNKVHALAQGNPILIKDKDKYRLSFTDCLYTFNDIQQFDVEGYKVVFGATFRNGRVYSWNNEKYRNIRIGIYPESLMKQRTQLEYI